MRWILLILIGLGIAVVAFSFQGQGDAFYVWHAGEKELGRIGHELGESIHRRIQSVAVQHRPRGEDWLPVRLTGIAVIVAAGVGFWMQRRRG